MPPWLPRVLTRIRALVAAGRVVLTDKARGELHELGLEREDFIEILRSVGPQDEPSRLRSGPGGDWLYVFRPVVVTVRLYVKAAIRDDCVVISCHEDEADAEEEANCDE